MFTASNYQGKRKARIGSLHIFHVCFDLLSTINERAEVMFLCLHTTNYTYICVVFVTCVAKIDHIARNRLSKYKKGDRVTIYCDSP